MGVKEEFSSSVHQGPLFLWVFGEAQHLLLGMGAKSKKGENFRASSSCTPTFFFMHPHNFLNPEIGLNILFEKGYRGYWK